MDELVLKKRWLQLFCIWMGYRLVITILDAPRNLQQIQMPYAMYLLGFTLLTSIAASILLYYCAYKKHGTRLLTFYLVVNGICLIANPIFLLTNEVPFWLLLTQPVDFFLTAWWLYLTVKLRSLNKKIQRAISLTAGNAASE